MRITVLCPDVSQNGLGRALLLAGMLRQDFEVDVVGSAFGPSVWEPARDVDFHCVVRGRRWPLYGVHARRLLQAIRGNVVYAVKPLPTSFGLALLHRARTGTPVVLDIDDDEMAFFREPKGLAAPMRSASELLVPNGPLLTRMAIARVPRANAVTVASTGLKARFGGSLIPHAKDTDVMRPGAGDRDGARAAAGIGDERVVMFAGTPRPFKGIEDAAAAVRLMRHRAVLVVAGSDPSSPYDAALRRDLTDVVFLPPFPLGQLASVLAMADAVIVPQPARAQTVHQLPSKLLDAMAMAKPIVATAVADVPAILGAGRGLVVPPSDSPALARALDAVFDDPAAAAAMGQRARDWCVDNASLAGVRPMLRQVVESVARRG